VSDPQRIVEGTRVSNPPGATLDRFVVRFRRFLGFARRPVRGVSGQGRARQMRGAQDGYAKLGKKRTGRRAPHGAQRLQPLPRAY
jgi:hypothetical protein